MQGLAGIYVCTVILNLQEHETSPHQPSGRSKSSVVFFPRLYLNQESSNECWGKGESWGERDREREKRRKRGVGREKVRERDLHFQWATSIKDNLTFRSCNNQDPPTQDVCLKGTGIATGKEEDIQSSN